MVGSSMVRSRRDHPGSFRPIGVAFHSLVGLYAWDRGVDIMLTVSHGVLVRFLLDGPLVRHQLVWHLS